MTRRPFDPRELDRRDADRDPVADELERYAGLTSGEAPRGLDERVMAALADEPPPRRGLATLLFSPFLGLPRGGMARTALVAATMAVAILAVVAAGELAGLFRNDQVGPSPVPSFIESPSATPSPSATHSPTLPVTPSPSSSATHSPVPPATSTPRPSGVETPGATSEPTDHETPEGESDHSETPRPSDSGNSGPGGGSGDDSS
jgi:hypothetical protein